MNREEIKKRIAEIKKQKRDIAKKKAAKIAELKVHEEANKMLFFGHPDKQYLGRHGTWKANPAQGDLITVFRQCTHQIYTITGANRIGKTFTEIGIILLTCLRGKFPWEPDDAEPWLWLMRGWRPPIKARLVGQDWEKHVKTVLIPALKELWPDEWEREVRKNSVGVAAFWTDKYTQSTLEIMSNNSDSDLFEGWNGHIVLYDEPPKRQNRIACARGLIDFNGIEVFAMTLLKEAWVDKEVINAIDPETGEPDLSVFNIHSDIYSNVGHGISEEGVKQFSKALSPEEQDARLRGVPSYKAGLILRIDRKIHVLNKTPNDIRPHWIIDIMIDYHPSKPQRILFVATDEGNFKYVCHAIEGHGDGYWIADQIVKSIDRYKMKRVNFIGADPLSKGDKNNIMTQYDKIAAGLKRFGHSLRSVGDLKTRKDDGIITINELLMTKNGYPALFIFKKLNESCVVPVLSQLENWMYDEHGKPSKEDDDYPENLYRAVLLKTKYFEPQAKKIKKTNQGRTTNKYSGY